MELDAAFRRRITEVFGERGWNWLDALPRTLAVCAERWRLRLEAPFALSYNYVVPGLRDDGSRVVLKLGVPDPEQEREATALRHYDGRGAVRLLDADAALGALLLERVEPGTRLVSLADDDAATVAAAHVMRALWRPPPADHAFPRVREWAAHLLDADAQALAPLPPALVGRAQRLYGELVASSAAPIVLHGDLHHENILRAGDGWLCIDPKGVLGEPAYECGALLRNPLPQVAGWPDLPRVLARRIDVLADALRFDRQRIIDWGIAQAVLSAVWSAEDHGAGWEPAIAVAGALVEVRAAP
ncbi:MAG: phosphotransferase [Dehalococcoidia bacterium]|nr:phosphotransferase [Dehalococcoidia bacterium]